MKSNWTSTTTKVVIWLAAEILLNVVGLDNLADYGEYVFDRSGVSEMAIATLYTAKI